jgi:hypothetical protein
MSVQTLSIQKKNNVFAKSLVDTSVSGQDFDYFVSEGHVALMVRVVCRDHELFVQNKLKKMIS